MNVKDKQGYTVTHEEWEEWEMYQTQEHVRTRKLMHRTEEYNEMQEIRQIAREN